MFSEIQYVTVCIFCVLSLFQRSNYRVIPAVVLSLTEVIHYSLFDSASGLLYYGSDALLDLLAIMIIAKLAIPTALAMQIMFICAASIILNYAGFAIWIAYMPPNIYNWGFVVLNLCTLICLIKREPGHGRQNAGDSSDSFVYRNNYFSH